jgi:hypothetical protein
VRACVWVFLLFRGGVEGKFRRHFSHFYPQEKYQEARSASNASSSRSNDELLKLKEAHATVRCLAAGPKNGDGNLLALC